jgi:CrcB protein
VFAAGVLGTAARLGLDVVLPADPGAFPISAFVINTVGSFALGVVVVLLPHATSEWLRTAVTTGLLGSFTTFSAVTVAAVALTGSGELLPAALLLVASVVAGVGAAAAGMAVGARPAKRRT